MRNDEGERWKPDSSDANYRRWIKRKRAFRKTQPDGVDELAAKWAKRQGYTHMTTVVKTFYDTTYHKVIEVDRLIDPGHIGTSYRYVTFTTAQIKKRFPNSVSRKTARKATRETVWFKYPLSTKRPQAYRLSQGDDRDECPEGVFWKYVEPYYLKARLVTTRDRATKWYKEMKDDA